MTAPVYLVVNLTITDPDRFASDYGAKVGPQLAAYGAGMIAMGQPPEVVEGKDDRKGAVIIRFPTRDAFDAWYGSEDYQPLRDVRVATTDTDTATLLLLTANEPMGDNNAA